MNLRPYQLQLKADIHAAWSAGHRNVMPVMPTGSGKTLTVADIMNDHNGAGIAIAHRAELIVQMSLAFAKYGIRHRVIGTPALAKICASVHVAELKKSFVDPRARMYVSSAQTLVRMPPASWMLEITKWACDEAHHVLADNTWGKVLAMFPNAVGLMPTATPCRADGMGLGRHADGLADTMVFGPSMSELMRQGWLTQYRIVGATSDIDISGIAISASGDFSPPKLAEAVHKSKTITGDVVSHYLTHAAGKMGLTFAVDLEAAAEYAQAFNAAGVRAEVISGNTPPLMRAELMRRFRAREILQLVNCDVLGEGTDVPAVEVVSDVAHTMSYGRFVQRFGRMLRPSEGKTYGLYIDHVGNVLHRHGLPDKPRMWSLDRRERRTRNAPDDVIPLRTCCNPVCAKVYERIYDTCPYCGTVRVIADRSLPETTDGQLSEFSPELLARLRGEIDQPVTIPYNATPVIVASVKKMHRERVSAQTMLRGLMGYWGGYRTAEGDDVGMQQRRFFINFGVDVLTAMALNKADAIALGAKIMTALWDANVEFTIDTGE
jgi:superfamily II DNA or RNA helicase